MSDAVRFHIPVHHGVDGEARDGLDAQFLGDVLAVGDDGGQADVQAVGNFLVDEAADDEYQHLDLSGGKLVAASGGSGGKGMSGGGRGGERFAAMPVLVQLQDGFGKVLLVQADVQRGDVPQLRGGFAARQHDGAGLAGQEEGGVLDVDLRGDEVVDVHVRRVVHQLAERTEAADDGSGDDLLEQTLQSQAGEGVGVDDGYLGCHREGR